MPQKKNKWMKYLVRPTFVPLWLHPFIEAYGTNVVNLVGAGLTKHIFVKTQEGIEWYASPDEFNTLGKILLGHFKQRPSFAAQIIKKSFRISKDLVKTCKEIRKTDFNKKSLQGLYELFLLYDMTFRDFVIPLSIVPPLDKFLTVEVQERVKDLLRKRRRERKLEDYFENLTAKLRTNESDQEELGLLKIAVEFEKQGGKLNKEIEKMVEDHGKKYAWMSVYAFHLEPLDKAYFLQKLKEITNPGEKIGAKRLDFKKKKESFERTIKELKPDKELLRLINTLQEFIFFREYRTNKLRQAFYNLQPLISEISRRLTFTKEEVSYLTYPELKEYLLENKKPDSREIRERIKHYLLLRKLGVYKIVSSEKEISKIVSEELRPEKIKWIKPFTREIHPFDWEPGIVAYSENFGGKARVGYKNQMYLPENSKHGFYYGAQDYQTFHSTLLQKIKSDPDYLEEEAKLCSQTCEEMVAAAKNLCLALKKKSNKTLTQLYRAYLEKFKPCCFYLEMIPAIESYLEENTGSLLREALKNQSQKKFFNYLTIISTKIKKVTAEEEEIDRLKLAEALRTKKDVNKIIDRHLKKYAWLPFYGLEMEPLKKEELLKEINKIENPKQQLTKRLNEIKEQERKLRVVKRKLASRDNKNLLEWIEILQDYLYLRTYRTDAYRRMLFNLKPFVEYLAEEASWQYHDVIYLRPSEIIDYLTNQKLPPFKEIQARQKQWAIIVENGALDFTSDKKQIEEIRKEELAKEEKEVKTLKGNVAQSGRAEGKVRLILTRKDWKKMKEGNILVTHMTTPEMILLIKKAAAIVTDEGGITCHAAIVSREFGIPCVVGTQIATKVLKDGNLVEVDAEKGTVKKLSKA